MNRTVRLIAGMAIGLIIAAGAYAKEKKIKQSELPPAVQKTAEQLSVGEGVAVTGYTVNKAEGATLYTMDLVADGLARKTVIGADGTLVSVQQEMAWDKVPAAVQTDFTNVTGKGKLGPVSSITKDGKIVTYEATLVTWGNSARVQVKPNAPALEAIPTADSNK